MSGKVIDMGKTKKAYNYLALYNQTGHEHMEEAEVIYCGPRDVVRDQVNTYLEGRVLEEADIKNNLHIFRIGSAEALEVEIVSEPQYAVNF